MAKRMTLMLVAALLLVFAATAVGCGGDDNDSSGSGDSSSQNGGSDSGSGSGSKDSGGTTPENLDEAVDKCLEEAEKAGNDEAKEAAKKLCNAAKSGDPEKIKKSAQDACLDLAKQIPLVDQRKEAEAACRQ